MKYRGYTILANAQVTRFYETSEDGDVLDEVIGVKYQQLDSEIWYSVVKDGFVQQSFETIEECKQFINSERGAE